MLLTLLQFQGTSPPEPPSGGGYIDDRPHRRRRPPAQTQVASLRLDDEAIALALLLL